MLNDTLLRDIAGDAELFPVEDLGTARIRLMAAIESEGSSQSSAHRRTGSWRTRTFARPLLAGGFAAVVVAAIVGAVVLLPGAGDDGAAQASPAQILDRAANATTEQPAPRADQFLYIKDSSGESWLSVDGTHDGRVIRSGEIIPLPGCKHGLRVEVKGDEVIRATEPCAADPAYLADAPTSTAGMTAFLAAHGGTGRPNTIGKSAVDLLAYHRMPAAAQASLFHVIATMPGLRLIPHVTDAAGRAGIGIAWTFDGSTNVLILDARSYAYLGMRTGNTGVDVLVTSKIVDHVGDRS
jgi:hypothetical protein